MEIADTFEFLLGGWTLSRWIEDRKNGISGTFVGGAVVTEAFPGGGFYKEAGKLRFHGYECHSARALNVARCEDGSVDLSFPDGRHYIKLDLRRSDWSDGHLCGCDNYQIDLYTQSNISLLERWRVRGPSKCYDALTYLRREAF